MQGRLSERKALDGFLAHWNRISPLAPQHEQWARRSARYGKYRRGECVYDSGWGEKKVFYVCSGLVCRITYVYDLRTKRERRAILSVGLPGMALMSTDHLHSDTQAAGELIALRPSEVLTFRYGDMLRAKEEDPATNKFVAALVNKKKRQLARLRQACAIPDPQSRYIRFTETLPELRAILSQTEQQDLLGISRSSVQRASYSILKGKKT